MLKIFCSIYLVHDDAKDKEFELEVTWISEESKGLHTAVPEDLLKEAKEKAQEALDTFD